jgi:hypothetical protein
MVGFRFVRDFVSPPLENPAGHWRHCPQRGSRGGVGAGILTWKRRFATEARYRKDAATFCYLSGGGVIT